MIDRYANHLAILYGYVGDEEARHIAKSVLLNPKLREIHTPFQRFWELEALFQAGEGKRALEEVRGAPNTVGTVKAFGQTARAEGSLPVEL